MTYDSRFLCGPAVSRQASFALEVVAGLLGRLRDHAETTAFHVVTGNVFGPLLVVAPVQTARLRFRSAGREDAAQPPLAVLMGLQ